ncbi:GNAT family N-acetyltransferase [Cohnella candidum]|uniref:GNAT family N-acetyltransferase n=1 Tax=Cohnella candidum TaxID=2674991 RepID=A0A3G3K2X1_9BACL|nr:GNAT family N-acetyltransferase [Cohnella candidum]AYQ74521.1 GNAT family N-acetyltransferase [Cohnella candidum]
MFVTLHPDDEILHRQPFTDAEVPYNLIHLICGNEQNYCLKSTDGRFIFAQTPGHKAWVWMADDVDDQFSQVLVTALIERIQDVELPGISGESALARKFAHTYSLARQVTYRTELIMESYVCPVVKTPSKGGTWLKKATLEHAQTLAEFCAGFARDAYGTSAEPSSQLPLAERMIQSGNLYLLFADSPEPVSMANIAHRSARHARINAVYTPPEQRKQGYASAVVSQLCDIVHQEGLIPMLYADTKNPDSNKVYRNIGFVESGKIAEIKFSK